MKKNKPFTELSDRFHDELCILLEDTHRRCQDADLRGAQFGQVVILHLLWAAAATTVLSTTEPQDKRAVEVFRLMLKQARHNEEQYSEMHS